jgi:hypothetical protein
LLLPELALPDFAPPDLVPPNRGLRDLAPLELPLPDRCGHFPA